MENLDLRITFNKQTGINIEANRETDSQEAAALIMVALMRTLQFSGFSQEEAHNEIDMAMAKNWGFR